MEFVTLVTREHFQFHVVADQIGDVSFLLQHPELCPHGRIVRITRQVIHHLPGGRAAAPVKDVHNLPLASRERCVRGALPLRHVIFITLVLHK